MSRLKKKVIFFGTQYYEFWKMRTVCNRYHHKTQSIFITSKISLSLRAVIPVYQYDVFYVSRIFSLTNCHIHKIQGLALLCRALRSHLQCWHHIEFLLFHFQSSCLPMYLEGKGGWHKCLVPWIHILDPGGIPDSWLRPVTAPAVAIWQVWQWLDGISLVLFLSFSLHSFCHFPLQTNQ